MRVTQEMPILNEEQIIIGFYIIQVDYFQRNCYTCI